MSENSGLVADVLYKTNQPLAVSLDHANAFKADIAERGARVALYRNYERGDHRAVISSEMRHMLRLPAEDSGIQDFNGNYCGIVIDKMAGRLRVSEIGTGDTEKDSEWLSSLLEWNDWENLQTVTFRGAIRDADSYIMVDPTDLLWTSEPAYDGFSGIVALFDTGMRTPYWACKIWSEADEGSSDNTMRLVVYQPGGVSYWRGKEGGTEVQPDMMFLSFDSPDLNSGEFTTTNIKSFPLKSGNVPIVHFANRYENYSEDGESELRAAIPLQDVYNRTLHSMVMASEFSAFRITYSVGMEINPDGIVPGATLGLVLKDNNGRVINEPTPEMLAFLQAVKVGQLEATDIGQYISELDKVVREISQVTQTPIYGVTTDNGSLSGEALKQLEIGLIGKVLRFQQQNSDAVRELIELTAEIQNTFRIPDAGNAPEIGAVSVVWKSPEILDVTSQITALSQMRTQAPGLFSDDWYRTRIGGLLGMSSTDIATETDKIADEVAARRRAIRDAQGKLPTRNSAMPMNEDTTPMVVQ